MTAIDSIIYKINATSCWIVIFAFMLILVSVIYVYRLFFLSTQTSASTSSSSSSDQEGFTINKEFTYKSGEESYDNFYAKMYDNLL